MERNLKNLWVNEAITHEHNSKYWSIDISSPNPSLYHPAIVELNESKYHQCNCAMVQKDC